MFTETISVLENKNMFKFWSKGNNITSHPERNS